MQTNSLRKTHPMVLIAAVAITVFSLLGSAVITGLIPRKQGAIEPLTISNEATTATSQAVPNIRNDSESSYAADYKSRVQPREIKPNSKPDKSATCDSCGKIVSISTAEREGNGFMIKIRMENGSYRIITQYNEPHYHVGDQVKLISKELTMA